MKILEKWLLQSVAEKDHKWAVSLIHMWGIDINCRNQLEETPLHLAVKNASKKIVKSLLSYHDIIDVNARDIEGNTPLHLLAAANRCDNNLMKLLMENPKIEVDIVNTSKKTPLHIAAESGNTQLVDSLLALSADINLSDNEQNTPLIISLIHHRREVTNMLLTDPNLNVNCQGNNLNTALHIVVEEGDVPFTKKLLEKKANPMFSNKKGNTPLHIASQEQYLQIVKLLVRNHQGGVNIRNEEDNTPLDIAKGCNKEIYAVLFTAANDSKFRSNPESNHAQLFKSKSLVLPKINSIVTTPKATFLTDKFDAEIEIKGNDSSFLSEEQVF